MFHRWNFQAGGDLTRWLDRAGPHSLETVMNDAHPSRATKLVSGFAFLGVTAAVLVTCSTPVLAVSCDDVRALTKVEQSFWAKKLSLTADQIHRIRQECYGQPHIREAKGDLVQPVAERR
jgi:hypothetical protein